MSHGTKKQHHEQARKKHKHDMEEHAREAAKRDRSKFPLWILLSGVVIVIAFVLVISLW